MPKAILDMIEALEIYATDKAQEWKKQQQKQDNSNEQYMAATFVWEAYRDMANRLADLLLMAEHACIYTKQREAQRLSAEAGGGEGGS